MTGLNQKSNPTIFLIGPMGSGKSTVGRELAKQLKWAYKDTDEVIEKKLRNSISQIFAKKGEQFFRKVEEDTILKLQLKSPTVVSLGGGSVTSPKVIEEIRGRGIVIYLHAPTTELIKRADAKNRPLLQGLSHSESLTKMRSLMKRRKKYYEKAHIKISTNGQSVENICYAIRRKLQL